MASFADDPFQEKMDQPTDARTDGPMEVGLLLIKCINGKQYVVPNALHFYYSAGSERVAAPRTD